MASERPVEFDGGPGFLNKFKRADASCDVDACGTESSDGDGEGRWAETKGCFAIRVDRPTFELVFLGFFTPNCLSAALISRLAVAC